MTRVASSTWWSAPSGSFRRSFTLPRTIRAEGITAEFDNGLLNVRLLKADEALSRKIEVSRRS